MTSENLLPVASRVVVGVAPIPSSVPLAPMEAYKLFKILKTISLAMIETLKYGFVVYSLTDTPITVNKIPSVISFGFFKN